MSLSSYEVTRVAGCGHTYEGYSFIKPLRPYCPACVPLIRAAIQQANREARDARPPARTGNRWFYVSDARRRGIYERDGWICQLCFDPVDASLSGRDLWGATLDHVRCRSWSETPDHSSQNLRLAHRWCNSLRSNEHGGWTAEDMRPKVA